MRRRKRQQVQRSVPNNGKFGALGVNGGNSNGYASGNSNGSNNGGGNGFFANRRDSDVILSPMYGNREFASGNNGDLSRQPSYVSYGNVNGNGKPTRQSSLSSSISPHSYASSRVPGNNVSSSAAVTLDNVVAGAAGATRGRSNSSASNMTTPMSPISAAAASEKFLQNMQRRPSNANSLKSPSIAYYNSNSSEAMMSPQASGAGSTTGVPESNSEVAPLIMKVLHPYAPTLADELELTAGQEVVVLRAFDDGWGLGMIPGTGAQGAFPLICVSSGIAAAAAAATNNSSPSQGNNGYGATGLGYGGSEVGSYVENEEFLVNQARLSAMIQRNGTRN